MSNEGFFKVIIIGDYSVGKSAIMNRLCHGSFTDKYNVTVGVEFESKEVEIDEEKVQLQIWDTAGQDKFRSLVRVFFNGVVAVFLTYAVDNRESFENLDVWLQEAKDKAAQDAIYILVGNKSDLEREIAYEEGAEYMAEKKLDIFFETSAKTGDNVQKVFFEAAKKILERRKLLGGMNQQYARNSARSNISLPELKIESGKKKKCAC